MWLCVCLHVWMYVFVCMHCMHDCSYVIVYLYARVYVFLYLFYDCVYTLYACLFVCDCVFVCVCDCACAYVYVCIHCACLYVCPLQSPCDLSVLPLIITTFCYKHITCFEWIIEVNIYQFQQLTLYQFWHTKQLVKCMKSIILITQSIIHLCRPYIKVRPQLQAGVELSNHTFVSLSFFVSEGVEWVKCSKIIMLITQSIMYLCRPVHVETSGCLQNIRIMPSWECRDFWTHYVCNFGDCLCVYI